MKYNIFNKLGFNTLFLATVLLSTSCDKELAEPTVDSSKVAYVAVHNFALLAGTTSSVFVNNTQLSLGGSNVALGVGGSSLGLGNYFGVNPGNVSVGFRTASGTIDYATRTLNVAQNSNNSFFAYDTLTTGGSAKILVLNNNMKAADTGTSNIRFLHLSPNAGNINVVLTRTLNHFGLATTGSVINLTNVPYIGSTGSPNEVTLSAFSNIPGGTYSVSVVSGSTTILSVAALTLREGKNYSIVLRGFAPPRPAIPAGQTLGLSLLLHNP